MRAYHRRLTSDDPATAPRPRRAHGACGRARPAACYARPGRSSRATATTDFALAFARIECHYFVNGGFFDATTSCCATRTQHRHIPGVIVHGRYDVVCPLAERVGPAQARWPEAELVIVPDAGHSAFEPGIALSLRRATDRYAHL